MLVVVVVWLIFFSSGTLAQEKKQYKVGCIAFYNLENLFDTIPGPNDVEFTPDGVNKWNTEKYRVKIDHMSDVISQIGNEMFPGGPAILGICEVENRSVVEDLVNSPKLKPSNYDIVHYDSPDKRGVDVAMIYRRDFFKVISSRSARLMVSDKPDWTTRNQLVVSGYFDNELIHVIVNHWPSRSGGEKRSEPLREAAAVLTRSIADSIFATDINSKIFIMGDLNDDPVNASVYSVLKAKGKIEDVKKGGLFNPMWKMYKDGIGSLAYRDTWDLFDQIIVSEPLLGNDKSTFKFFKAKVFNAPFITQKTGQYAGYPFRTYVGNTWQGGYGDHFPAYIFIIKEK
ncbi:MAG TPA: endonuclease [Bacteroidales bacterium]|nr:endonuclease [Bacteroidales bacterium]